MSAFRPIGTGSSKNLLASDAHPEHLFFDFSDRVSVFDYGALPEAIPGKGIALERSARFFFDLLAQHSLPTAFDAALTANVGKMALRAARHPKFEVLAGLSAQLEFIPLEIIFRWGVTPGSSYLKRHPELQAFTRFDTPVVEFSTKLEASDRMVNDAEAAELAGSADLLVQLRQYALRVATVLRDRLQSSGLQLWDGKIECAFDRATGQILMVDALTLDELRVTLPEFPTAALSKELLRQWIGGTDWAFQVLQAKRKHGAKWKLHVDKPPRLGPWRTHKFAELYSAFNEALGASSNAPLLEWLQRDARRPRVFVLGEGGREAALKWRLEQEGCEVCSKPEDADTVWVSQDGDLAAGKVDWYREQGFWTYGPQASSARLESSKAFGKDVAQEAEVRLPRCSTRPEDLRTFSAPPVVKIDGLAAGKGVVVPETWNEAESALREFSARGPIVLEERCRGYEASAFFAVETGYNGVHTRYLGSARDFKRRYARDEGPNTGGMGAYAPHPAVQAEDVVLFKEWAQRTAEALVSRDLAFNGILYLGAMRDVVHGWVLLEYNARLGDPETEALVRAWADGPVLRSILKLDVRADFTDVQLSQQSVCVALVRKEYPAAAAPLALPNWTLTGESRCVLFRNASSSGRVAFLVGTGEDILHAGDEVFECLLHSPWREILDWRADIIP